MTYNAKETGKRLRDCRKERGISLQKESIDLCVSLDHLRRIETGAKAPSLDLLIMLSDYLSVSIDYLLKGDCRSKTRDELIAVISQLNDIASCL